MSDDRGALAAVVLSLAISNVLANRVLPAWAYVPWSLAVALVVVAIGLRHRAVEQLGLANWRSGARWGASIAAAIALILLVAVAIEPTRELFDDRRVDDRWVFLAYHVVVRIPFGTVLLEELAFRSVLPALLTRRTPNCHDDRAGSAPISMTDRVGWRGGIGASALFGLWHVLPAWELGDVNPALADLFGDDAIGQSVAITLAVAGTFLAGVGLWLLRYWSGSVLAPIIVHVATNSGAYSVAWLTA